MSIEYHQKRIKLIGKVISGVDAICKLRLLDAEYFAPEVDILKTKELNDSDQKVIAFYQAKFRESLQICESQGADPYPLSDEEKEPHLYPDPYRLRAPGWIRIPIQNFIRGIFK